METMTKTKTKTKTKRYYYLLLDCYYYMSCFSHLFNLFLEYSVSMWERLYTD